MLRSFLLQRVVFLIVSGKIHCLSLRRNPLTGIIFKTPAFVVNGFAALLGTENPTILQICSMQTVAAGTFYLFTKQHVYASKTVFFNYTGITDGLPELFCIFPIKRTNRKMAASSIHPYSHITPMLSSRLKTVCSPFPRT